MKKSFKKAIAILLAVMMVVCAFPMSAFAADEAKPNVNIRLGAFTSDAANTKYYKIDRNHAITGINAISGINSTALDYTGTAITGYGVGDYFTATVVLENVSQIAAAQIAVKYSDTIEPAGVLSGTAGFYSGSTTATPYATYVAGEAIAAQSGDALYNTAHTVGEMSYAADGVMYADFAVQDGSDYVTSSTGYFYLATFAFKIVKAGDITFSMVDDATEEDAFFLGTLENGAKEEEYVTFVETENDGSKGLGFMGKDADGESVIPTKSYTITFVDAEGATISTGTYNEGATVTAPELPSTTKDADNHYTYAWDVTPAATATADATYTVVKTPAAHTWNTGVETIPATEEAEGEMTYTCTVCSQTKTEPIKKLEPSHTHEYVWVYNGDATYTNSTTYTDGTATGTCSCGDTKTKTIANTGLFRARTANAEFGSAVKICVGTRHAQANSFKEHYCKFIRADGVEFIVKADDKKDHYDTTSNTMFKFGVNPQSLNSDVKIVFYGVTEDDITVWGPEYTYNMVQNYIINQLNTSTNNNWKKLLVELMYFGYYNQQQAGWDLEHPIIDFIPEGLESLHDSNIPNDLEKIQNTKYEVIENPIAWKSINLQYGDATKIRFISDVYTPNENTRAVVSVDGEAEPFEYSYVENPELFEVNASSGRCTFIFPDLPAKRLRSAVYVQMFENEKPITNVFQYSAETYCQNNAIKDPTEANLATKITNQLMKYANAAKAYFGV